MTKYNTEFKMKVVNEYLEGNVSYKDLAKNTVSHTSLLLESGLTLMNLKVMMD